jgi:hypothetical protein
MKCFTQWEPIQREDFRALLKSEEKFLLSGGGIYGNADGPSIGTHFTWSASDGRLQLRHEKYHNGLEVFLACKKEIPPCEA